MDPTWVVNGTIDSEQKEYLLMAYFQKLNRYLEDIKLYPMFTELSIHLGNIQTLITQNKMLISKKKFLHFDDELNLSDLELTDIHEMTEIESQEFKKVLQTVQPKLFDYFNIVKAIWSLVYDSISISVKRNLKNMDSNHGFFYYKLDDQNFIWRYDVKKINGFPNQTKTTVKKIYQGDGEDLTIIQLISKFSLTYKTKKEKTFPIFEVKSTQNFPIDETLAPIAKRKILAFINQSVRYDKLLQEKKLLENGV